MTQQRATIIDVTRSFLPGDPNAFPENMRITQAEDAPEKAVPIMAYEGVNILPTAYGYRAYFGTNSVLDISPLPSLCSQVLLFQTAAYENILLALCADGIWAVAGAQTEWRHTYVLADDWTSSNIYRQYTHCVIENDLYIYRQGHDKVIKLDNNVAKTADIGLIPSDIEVTSVNTTGDPDEDWMWRNWRVLVVGIDPATDKPATVAAADSRGVSKDIFIGSPCTISFTQLDGVTEYKPYFISFLESGEVEQVRSPGVLSYAAGGISWTPSPFNTHPLDWPDVTAGADVLPGGDLILDELSPSFLNMEGQMGIFRANGRLGFWDSANSVSWSSAFDFSDFNPAVETLAGNTTFFGVLGRIVTIKSHGEGFVIYATKSIVGVGYTTSGTLIWDAQVITDNSGIYSPDNVAEGVTSREHYAYTSGGIVKVGNFNALSRKYEKEDILPELYDYLKEQRAQVKVECLKGRYLFLCMVDARYISGTVSHTVTGTGTLVAPLFSSENVQDILDGTVEGPMMPQELYKFLYTIFRNPTGDLRIEKKGSTASFDMPLWAIYGTMPAISSDIRNKGFFLAGYSDNRYNMDGVPWYELPKGNLVPESEVPTFGGSNSLDFTDYNYPSVLDMLAGEEVAGFFTNTPYLQDVDISLDAVAEDLFYPSSGTPLCSDQGESLPKSCIDTIFGLGAICDRFSTYIKAHMSTMQRAMEAVPGFEVTIRNCPAPGASPVIEESVYSFVTLYDFEDPHFVYEHIPGEGGTKVAISAYVGRTIHKFDIQARSIHADKDLDGLEGLVSEAYLTLLSEVTTTPVVIPAEATLSDMEELLTYTSGYDEWAPNFTEATEGISMDQKRSRAVPIEVRQILSPITKEAAYYNATQDAALDYTWAAQDEFNYHSIIAGGPFDPNYYLWAESTHNRPDKAWFVDRRYFSSAVMAMIALRRHGEYLGMDGLFAGEPGIALPIQTVMGDNIYFDPSDLGIEEVADEDAVYITANIEVDSERPGRYRIMRLVRENIPYLHTLSVTPVYAGVAQESSFLAPIAKLVFQHVATQVITPVSDTEWGIDSTAYLKGPRMGDPAVLASYYEAYTDYPPEEWVNVSSLLSVTRDVNTLIGEPIANKNCWNWHVLGISQDRFSSGSGRHFDFMSQALGTILKKPVWLGPISNVAVDDCGVGVGEDGNILESGFPEEVPVSYEIPGSSFTLQEGIPAAGYYTYTGALVYDMGLKKWGKYAGNFSQLISYSPINATNDSVIDFTNFGVDAGILDSDGFLHLFDANPADAWIRYGKVGYYRLGFTNGEEVRAQFRGPATGNIIVEGSLDGVTIDERLTTTAAYTSKVTAAAYLGSSAKWYSIKIEGQFDLNFLEFRGTMGARR